MTVLKIKSKRHKKLLNLKIIKAVWKQLASIIKRLFRKKKNEDVFKKIIKNS